MSDSVSWESKFRTREIAAHEWEDIRDVFEDLYIEQGQTLKMIRQHLAEDYGFYAKYVLTFLPALLCSINSD